MSLDATLDARRAEASWGILKRFGAEFEKTAQSLSQRLSDPHLRKLAAARISLEHAVIQTALEKNTPTQVVATALEAAQPAQQAMLVNEGRAAMERAYGLAPDVVVSAMAGKVVDVPLPRGFVSNPEFDKLIDSSRNLVTAIVQDRYQNRGKLQDHGERASFVELAKDTTKAARNRVDLATNLAFIESAIDAGVKSGKLDPRGAEMLKERVEAFVFQPRPPQSLSYTQEFHNFYQHRGKEMQTDVMKEVRAITQSKTVLDIAAKLDEARRPPDPIRQAAPLER